MNLVSLTLKKNSMVAVQNVKKIVVNAKRMIYLCVQAVKEDSTLYRVNVLMSAPKIV